MDIVQLHDLRFRPYIPAGAIQQRIKELAMEMNRDLKHENPLFIGILNGVFMFAADLMKELQFNCEIIFVRYASYNGTKSSGSLEEVFGITHELKGRNIVIIEDIIDTGQTMNKFLDKIKTFHPESVRIASLLFKPDSLEHNIEIDYLGFSVPNEFLVGYVLDYDGLGRNLKSIYVKC